MIDAYLIVSSMVWVCIIYWRIYRGLGAKVLTCIIVMVANPILTPILIIAFFSDRLKGFIEKLASN